MIEFSTAERVLIMAARRQARQTTGGLEQLGFLGLFLLGWVLFVPEIVIIRAIWGPLTWLAPENINTSTGFIIYMVVAMAITAINMLPLILLNGRLQASASLKAEAEAGKIIQEWSPELADKLMAKATEVEANNASQY